MALPRNPYIAGKALSGTRGFTGRDDIFHLVQTVLEQSDANAIVLFGQRRIGKTSIMLQLHSRLPSSTFVPVFFDLQDRARRPMSEVLFELAQTIAAEANLAPPTEDDFEHDGVNFRTVFLPAVYQALGDGRRLVLLFDEFDVLDARQEEQLPVTSAARSFIPYMRRLMNEESELGFVFVVGRKADELGIEFKAAFKTARYHRISVLKFEAARRLILTAQRKGSLQFAEGVPERILALSAGHPYFTQLLCQLLFEQAYEPMDFGANSNDDIVPVVSLDCVHDVVPKALEAGENVFEWIWDGLPPAERVIFAAVAAGTDEETVVTEEQLLDVLQAQGIRILIRELELAPKTLVEWEMLKEVDGGFRFYVELMRMWVADRKPLARVKDELDRINPLADTLYQAGTAFYRNGALGDATNQLRTALNVNPNHLKARLLLGEIYKIQGDNDAAVLELTEAYRIDPDGARLAYENALLQQAEAYEKAGQFPETLATYDRILEISPRNRVVVERREPIEKIAKEQQIAALTQKASQLETRERWDDAFALYEQLSSLDDDPQWQQGLERVERERNLARRYGEGLVLASRYRWVEAQAAFADVVSERPGYKDAAARMEQAAKEQRSTQFALTTEKGRRMFRFAWIGACMVGWLMGLAISAVFWTQTSLIGDAWILLFWILLSLITNLTLQSVLLRRFMSSRGRRRWVNANVIGSAGITLSFFIFLVPFPGSLLGFLAIPLFIIIGISFIQERICLFPEVGAPTGWMLPSVAGRVLGIGAGIGIVYLIYEFDSLMIGNVVQEPSLVSIFIGGAVWGLVSGAFTGPTMARILVRGMEQIDGEEQTTAPVGYDRVLQTWLPVAASIIALVAVAVVITRVTGLAVPRLEPEISFFPEDYRYAPDASISFSPGDEYLLASNGSNALVWDMMSHELLYKLGHDDVMIAAISPDGQRIASGSADGTVRVWDMETGQSLHVLEGHESDVISVAWSPDGTQVLTGSSDDSARVWDVETGQSLHVLEWHESDVISVAWSPDGTRVLMGDRDGTTQVWDVETGQSMHVLEGHADAVRSVAWSPDGTQVLTGSSDDSARVWDVETGQSLHVLEGHEGDVISVAWSPDGTRVLTGSSDNSARVWDVDTGQSLHVLEGHEGDVISVAWSPDGTRVLTTGSWDTTARVWDVDTGQSLHVLEGHAGAVNSVAWSPDGKHIVTAGADNTLRMWDILSGGLQFTMGVGDILSVVFSPDGERIATVGVDLAARIWDSNSGSELHTLLGHDDVVTSIAYSPDGMRIVTGSADDTARVWDAQSGAEILILTGHENDITGVAYSPDGLNIVTGSSDDTARVWDAQSGAEILTLVGHEDDITSVAYSPGGLNIVTGSEDATARQWDAQLGKELHTLNRHNKDVNSVAFSPDGQYIVTGSSDVTARIWDAKTGVNFRTLRGINSDVTGVAFSHDGKQIAIIDANGHILIFMLK